MPTIERGNYEVAMINRDDYEKEEGRGGGVVVDPSKCLPLEKKDFTLFSIDESIAESIGIILQGRFDREILLIRDIH